MRRILAPVNTGVYGGVNGTDMSDQLSASDWVDAGLKALASRGFTALKAEPLAKALRVSRGSFYWHFADIAAFHAAILARWHEVAAEQIIANVEAASNNEDPLAQLLRRVFRIAGRTGSRPRANPLLGISRLRAVGSAAAEGAAAGRPRRVDTDCRRMTACDHIC
jgi:AcrR family transcriptional regulator